MNTNINTAKKVQVDAGYETSKFALGVGISMATLVGIWGAVSMLSALVQNGPVNLVKGLMTAITGI